LYNQYLPQDLPWEAVPGGDTAPCSPDEAEGAREETPPAGALSALLPRGMDGGSLLLVLLLFFLWQQGGNEDICLLLGLILLLQLAGNE
jgi:hypothetical protein